jgi:uncharacterized RDD family membrane protein YckC
MVVCRHCGTANQPGQVSCSKCLRDLIDPSMIGKIPCTNHANREATTSCNSCGSRLCDQCAYLLGELEFCESCAPEGAIPREHDDYEMIPVVEVGNAEVGRPNMASRILSFVIDTLIAGTFAAVLAFLLAMFAGGVGHKTTYLFLRDFHRPHFWIFWPVLFLATLAYHVITVGMTGQTLGKYIMGIIVLNPDGTVVTTRQALIRALGQIVSILPLGLGLARAFRHDDGDTWHDKMSGTMTFRYQDMT